MLFNATIGLGVNQKIPAEIDITLSLNGTTVNGGTARHSFTSTGNYSTISFTIPIMVTENPSTLNVISSATGFIFSDVAITVLRLGDLSNQKTEYL